MVKICNGVLADRIVLACFAIFIQVQITLFASDDYQGLRINAADLLLPLMGIFILGSLVFKNSVWPRWQRPFGYWAPILLTIVIILALLNGYRIQGSWNHWAIINKGVGWFALMGYLALGAWLAQNKAKDIRRWFLQPFLIFLCAVSVMEIILCILIYQDILPSFNLSYFLQRAELTGFMVNRNAFAFLYLSTLTLSGIYLIKSIPLHPIETICFKILWGISSLFIVMNASRTLTLVFAVLVIFLIVLNWKTFAQKILPFVLIGLLFSPLINFNNFSKATDRYKSVRVVLTSDQQEYKTIYSADNMRYQVASDSLKLLKEHPITGAGLGTVYEYQKVQDRQEIAIIDNTPLWVLTEMGPFGFIAFASVFLSIIMALQRKSRTLSTDEQYFAHAVLFIMICFGLFSLLHELLYTRFLWLFLGLALNAPALMKPQDQ